MTVLLAGAAAMSVSLWSGATAQIQTTQMQTPPFPDQPLAARRAQLERGAGVYLLACAMCHGDQLQGAGAEALAGDHFRQTYGGLPPRAVYGLLSGLHGHLPPLTEQEALDVTAFVLDANRLPLPPSGVQSSTLDHPALP